MSDVQQTIKLENSWGETLKTTTGFRFFARHTEFILGVVFGSVMTFSSFHVRNYRIFR